MGCYSNCSRLNLSTCDFIEEETNIGEAVLHYDVDDEGCFEEEVYLGAGDKYTHYLQFARIISVITMVCGGAGILGNCAAIFVLSRPEMKNCFSNILITLNTSDSLHILFAILDGVRNNFELSYPQVLMRIFPFFHYPFYRITMCSSIFLVMGTAVERYLAVCRPHHYRTVQDKPCRYLVYVLPSIFAATFMNIPRFFDTETVTSCWDYSSCGCGNDSWLRGSEMYVKPTDLRRSKEYVVFYHTWVWGFLTGFIPVVCLIFLNTKIYLAMKKIKSSLNDNKKQLCPSGKGSETARNRVNQQKKDCNLSIILIVTVIMFFIFHTPRIIISFYEAVTIQSLVRCTEKGKGFFLIWYLYVQAALQLLQVLNSSQNFPIYWSVGTGFKNTFKKQIKNCWFYRDRPHTFKGTGEGECTKVDEK